MTVPVFAATTSDGFEYSISNGEVTITGYTGTVTELVVPETIGSCSVTTIGDDAFFWCESLVSITLPESVTSIGDCAFFNCTNLVSIDIPDGVTSISFGAFSFCTSLVSIMLPESVTTIDYAAFFDCVSLSTIYYAGTEFDWNNISVEDDNDPLFNAEIVFVKPESDIPEGLEYFVKNGEEVTITGYTGTATELVVPEIISGRPVAAIGDDAFYYCTKLESITVSEENSVYHSDGNCLIETATKTLVAGCKNSIFPSDGSVTTIGNYAFANCTSLEITAIPDCVTTIGEYAFFDCESLESINIPEGVTTIEEGAFGNCYSIKNITIPEGVTTIYNHAFVFCLSLESVTLPESLTTIGDDAFFNCTNLESITIPLQRNNHWRRGIQFLLKPFHCLLWRKRVFLE